MAKLTFARGGFGVFFSHWRQRIGPISGDSEWIADQPLGSAKIRSALLGWLAEPLKFDHV